MTCDSKPPSNNDSRVTNLRRYENSISTKNVEVNKSVGNPGTGTSQAQAFKETDNAYPHNPENVVVNGSGTANGSSGTDEDRIPLNMQFIPNELDAYDSVTYHWKLFITNQEASKTGDVFNKKHQTIIAETGVSDLTIDKVEIQSNATPSIDSGTGTAISVKFEILEPAGAGLIDKIFYQSVALGIGNWNVMPFYLQLQFRARSPDSSEAEDGSPGFISNKKWLWSLKVNTITANVTTVGTVYEFSAIIYDQLAQSNAYFVMQQPFVLENLSTFENAMKKLQDKLNEDQIFRLIDNNGIPDSYRIVVDPEIARFNITPIDAVINSVRSNNTINFGKKDATFPSRTSIDKIIDTLLAQTTEYQDSLTGKGRASGKPGELGSTMKSEISQMKSFWRITTESRPIVFDPLRVDYAREFTIFVFKYDVGIMAANTLQTSAPPQTLAAERKRLKTYADKSILKKKYNYIYTGLNDQVIKFDIKINNAFAQAQSRMGGIYTNASMHDMGVQAQENAAEEAAISKKVRDTLSMLNTSASTSSNSISAYAMEQERQDSIKETQQAINNSKLPPEKRKGIQTILDTHSKPESRLGLVRAAQESATLEQAAFQAKTLATPRNEKLSRTDLRFISDVDQTSTEAQDALKDYVKMLKGKLRPIAMIDSMHQRQIGQSVESNSNSGIAKLSSIFAVALHSNLDGSYAQSSITVKGDTFWLFPPPYTSDDARIFNSRKPDDVAINTIKNGHKIYKDSANLYGTDNFIIIRFKTPRVYNIDDNEEGGSATTDVEAFSGLFRVISVTSTFSGGVFTQELHCQLDPNLNILNFSAEIDAANQVPDIILTDTNVNNIPEEFSKKQRIRSTNPAPGVEPRILGNNIGVDRSNSNII